MNVFCNLVILDEQTEFLENSSILSYFVYLKLT